MDQVWHSCNGSAERLTTSMLSNDPAAMRRQLCEVLRQRTRIGCNCWKFTRVNNR